MLFFVIYFLGGSVCILGGYLERVICDFDILDLNYLAVIGKVLCFLGDFDFFEYESLVILFFFV